MMNVNVLFCVCESRGAEREGSGAFHALKGETEREKKRRSSRPFFSSLSLKLSLSTVTRQLFPPRFLSLLSALLAFLSARASRIRSFEKNGAKQTRPLERQRSETFQITQSTTIRRRDAPSPFFFPSARRAARASEQRAP